MIQDSVGGHRHRWAVAAAVALMLSAHAALAVHSLLRENATVDEVAHLPAGVSYWQKGTFRLYHHNPPLVKLVAALPVLASDPKTDDLYKMKAWEGESQAAFGQYFARENAPRYFELFDRARLVMPLFTVLGGLVVFAWSSRLYGTGGGLLSLALWCLCPNILAHGRLVTGDGAATAIGAGATYLFWRYQKHPTWTRAALVGLALGVAQLTKFSMILLYGFWPLLAALRFAIDRDWEGWPRRLAVGLGRWSMMVALSVVVIDAGYAFEGVGTPLGRLEFACRSLTRPVPPGMARPTSENSLLGNAWRYRVNRFRGTALGSIPSPLPRHYLLGFDEQKLETEGIPTYHFDPTLPHDESKVSGYTVYLDGRLSLDGGWWYFYLATLAYKVPEGTWALVALSGLVLILSKRSRAPWADELTLLVVPVGVLGAMSFLTDICIGLRYVLPIFPYAFIACGKVVPWAVGTPGRWKGPARALVGGCLLATAAATATIHPDYLAYFNRGLRRPRPGGRASDRQQPGLGPGPRQARPLAEGEPPRRAGRPGVFRPDQSEPAQAPMVPAPRLAGDDRTAGQDAGHETPGRPGASVDAGALRRQRLDRPGPALAVQRPRLDPGPSDLLDAGMADRGGGLRLFSGNDASRAGRTLDLRVPGHGPRTVPVWRRSGRGLGLDRRPNPRRGRAGLGLTRPGRIDIVGRSRAGGHDDPSHRPSSVGPGDSVFRRETDDVRAVSRELDGDPATTGHALPGGRGRIQRDGVPGSPDSRRQRPRMPPAGRLAVRGPRPGEPGAGPGAGDDPADRQHPRGRHRRPRRLNRGRDPVPAPIDRAGSPGEDPPSDRGRPDSPLPRGGLTGE